MSNQDQSPKPEESSGTNTPGPVDEMWAEYMAATGMDTAWRPDMQHNAKYVWFCSSVSTYNLILAAIRSQSPVTLAGVTEALRLNFEKYFATFAGPMDKPTPPGIH